MLCAIVKWKSCFVWSWCTLEGISYVKGVYIIMRRQRERLVMSVEKSERGIWAEGGYRSREKGSCGVLAVLRFTHPSCHRFANRWSPCEEGDNAERSLPQCEVLRLNIFISHVGPSACRFCCCSRQLLFMYRDGHRWV